MAAAGSRRPSSLTASSSPRKSWVALFSVCIPVAGVIGIAFAVMQWVLVSRVKLSPAAAAAGGSKNGYGDYLIEEDEGLNDHNIVVKCAEIQNAISEGDGAWPPPSPFIGRCDHLRRASLSLPGRCAELLRQAGFGRPRGGRSHRNGLPDSDYLRSVSYTHLTLPTIA